GTDSDEVPFQTDPLTVRTEASKTIAPNELWGLPGVDSNLQISGKISDDSNVGAESLVLVDPADPANDSAFWNAVSLDSIRETAIPACTELSVAYWSKAD